MKKTIFILFAILLFFVPLILWPATSEVFEFNKMVLVYILTTGIVAAWLLRCLVERRFVFRRTILDIPLLLFLGSQLISTLLSIDPLTSWFGYYSRFNGGMLSVISYSLLYWAFVSNLTKRYTLYAIRFLLASATLVSIYGVLEHFGIDKNIWVQDVQSRVFSTLGQPNWLAAWLVALIPITWANAIFNFQFSVLPIEFSRSKFINFLIYFTLSILFFWTLIFTKSRSGLLGIGVAALIFGGLTIWRQSRQIKRILLPSALIGFSILIVVLISGTELTPSLSALIAHSSNQPINQSTSGTSLETGGTESGTIRKIVWKGAIDIWAHYPIFGTGVETFAYSYYKFRPLEHNLTSEWDFIYNKAHNEFLNTAANTGTIGLIAYLILIGTSLLLFVKKLEFPISNFQSPIKSKSKNSQIENSELTGNWQLETGNLKLALLAGYVSLSVTNFFGFSVVPTQLQFFLFPAIAVVSSTQYVEWKNSKEKISEGQKVLIVCILLATFYLLQLIGKYWYADTLYAKGKAENGIQKPDAALPYLTRAISLEPSQPLYHTELANSYTSYALAYYQKKDANKAKQFADLAISESDKSLSLSPANINLKRSRFGVFIMLSAVDPKYLINAQGTLLDAINYAPTDAKLYYNLGLVYARTGQTDLALSTLKKTVDLKANYREARLAYALLLIDKKQNAEAKTQLEYILKYIDPNDSLTKQTLENIK